ncbi:hypothetical protein LMH87_000653 [Akanthomyces muscarius]|uniref:Uncharacterized protein n=1 Tax=Akanthomyces muscarius TaxID=2231603 RepID=A0A9W8QFF6_AKAMU|nr:hypothetical protein LMH87_000653 [Akanthomyces muscarius]KAJ4155410.1 hypothetical protein LMH87_000653 [Akanthomyces muscarius]
MTASGTLDLSKDLCQEITRHFGLDRNVIEAISPCTPFQRDVVNCASNEGRHAIGNAVYEVSEDVDADRLAAAWKDSVQCTPALRACIFTSKAGDSFQLVLRESFVFARMSWTSASLKSTIMRDEASAAVAGPRCNRFVLLGEPNTKRVLIWTFSHAFVDTAFRGRILKQVLAAYKDEHGRVVSLPPTPELVDSEDEGYPGTPVSDAAVGMLRATLFWREKLGGLDASVFPHLSSHLTAPAIDKEAKHHIPYPPSVQHK